MTDLDLEALTRMYERATRGSTLDQLDAGVDLFHAFPAIVAEIERLRGVEKAAQCLLGECDQFVLDTGIQHRDPITDAADDLRAALSQEADRG